MQFKLCTKCNKQQLTVDFYKSSGHTCKFCIKQQSSNYYKNNKEKCLLQAKTRIKLNNRKYQKKWATSEKGKEYHRLATKKYRNNNKNKILAKNQEPKNKLIGSLRTRLREALKRTKWNKSSKTKDLLGCDLNQFKIHLEKQFQPGMSWENYGLFGWHIDHIVPLSSANTEEEIFKLCHYTNLQPLWAKDNLSKANKLTKFK